MEVGTANVPKAKEHQKLRVGAYELEENQKDLYTEGSDSEELRDTVAASAQSSGSGESSEFSESHHQNVF